MTVMIWYALTMRSCGIGESSVYVAIIWALLLDRICKPTFEVRCQHIRGRALENVQQKSGLWPLKKHVLPGLQALYDGRIVLPPDIVILERTQGSLCR
jgi:hypothetical protein